MKPLITARLLGSALSAVAAHAQSVERTPGGVTVTPAGGPGGTVELTVHGDGIIHVVTTPKGSGKAQRSPSLMVAQPPVTGAFQVTESAGQVRITTAKATAEVALATGQVRFLDPAGKPLLAEAGPVRFTATSADGKPFVSVSQQFNRGTDEALYGLGQHQNSQMDYNGEDVELAQHNMDIGVPFVVSTRGYGLLWDNNSITRVGNPTPYAFVGEGMK
eukprot:gene32649-37702_t